MTVVIFFRVFYSMSSRSNLYRLDRKEVERLYHSRNVSDRVHETGESSGGATVSPRDIQQEAIAGPSTQVYNPIQEHQENEDSSDSNDESPFVDESPGSEEEAAFNEEPLEVASVAEKFISWHLKYNVSENATNDLLSWFKDHHFPQLPRTIKTLKMKSRLPDVTVQRMGDGQFCYFGLQDMIKHILSWQTAPIQSYYELQFGIDGIPLTSSSRSTFWPILVKIKAFPNVLPVAVYHGISKPRDVHDYMREFVNELNTVLQHGVEYGNKQITFGVSAFIMDAQAKSFIMDIKVLFFDRLCGLHKIYYPSEGQGCKT